MTHTIIFEKINDQDYELIKELADRLGLPIVEIHTGERNDIQEARFAKIFGRWDSEESAEELAGRIRAARQDAPRDIEL